MEALRTPPLCNPTRPEFAPANHPSFLARERRRCKVCVRQDLVHRDHAANLARGSLSQNRYFVYPYIRGIYTNFLPS
jgi:ribosomal protein S14